VPFVNTINPLLLTGCENVNVLPLTRMLPTFSTGPEKAAVEFTNTIELLLAVEQGPPKPTCEFTHSKVP